MRTGITSKLFVAILLPCLIVAIAMSTAMRYSFNQGFLGYLNEQEQQRLESLGPTLAAAYRERGGWEFLRDRPRTWFRLIRPPGVPEPPDEHYMPPPPTNADLTGLNLRVSLLDADKQLVVGNPRTLPEAELQPINVDGRTVGWLALVPFQQVSAGAALRFQQRQMQASWVIGGLALLLAAAAAFLLARSFLAPLKRIGHTTRQLALGDYHARAQVAVRDEIGRLAEDVNSLATALERNEQLRRGFMADVSHELRTPLAVMKAELEAIEDGIRPMSVESIRSLQGETAMLGKLIDDLYDLSLSDAGALTYRKARVDVAQVLQMTADGFRERLAERRVTLELHIDAGGPFCCDADPDRMRQLFSNLFENAARYVDSGGRLAVRCARGAGRMVQIDFQDSGPGVPDDLLPHLFERFYRGEQSRSRATGGAGLGLAICRNIVEAHGGRITARRAPAGGLWIAIALPPHEEDSR